MIKKSYGGNMSTAQEHTHISCEDFFAPLFLISLFDNPVIICLLLGLQYAIARFVLV